MSRNIIHSIVLAALAGFSSLSLAQDLPAAVGRISSVQGQVMLIGSDEPVAAALNWPVTSANHINTATGARTEFRIGSTAVRVDGDSDLEITDLDDDLLRLRLNYGSVSIRIRSPELLRDFELSTPQARITMIEPGVLRVDADRIADTSQIGVMAGSARVDGAGSSVTVNNGRHVDVTNEDVRTSVANRDGFDVWAEDRDRADQNAVVSTRFVSSGITGYEELDRNGSWNDSVEYGALWTPRNVAADWAPYRDGRWIWLAPWGWTWVDNAPWGYAPSHYGRWVMVGRRWSWAPGRPAGRPVWAPALVGWVGGEGPNHRGPGLGWFPLSPRERFVPTYRVSAEQERRMTWTHNGKPLNPGPDRGDHRNGLTLLPRDQFEGRRMVQVGRNPQMIQAPNLVRNVTPVAPPQPAGPSRVIETPRRGVVDRDHDGRPDRNDRNDRNDRFERNNGQPTRVLTAPSQPQPVAPQAPGRQQTLTTLAPSQFGTPNPPPQPVPNNVLIDARPRFNPHGGQPQSQPQSPGGQAVNPVRGMQVTPQISPPANQQTSPQASPQTPPRERNDRGDDERRRFRGQEEQRQPQQQVQQPQQPQPRPQQQAAPQPQPQPQQIQQRPQPQPQPQPQPAPQAQPAPHREPEKRQNDGRDRGDNKGDNRGDNRRQNSQ